MRTWHIAALAVAAAVFALLAVPVLSVATAYLVLPELRSADERTAEPESEAGPEEPPPQARPEEGEGEETRPAPPEPGGVDISEFDGLSGNDSVFDIHVNEAYIDDDGTVTDGAGFYESAPDGMDYAVFNLQITNTSGAPAAWDGYDHVATGAGGNTYFNDADAEFAAADEYFQGEFLNPGESVETDAIFAVPQGESLVEVELNSTGGAAPMTLVP